MEELFLVFSMPFGQLGLLFVGPHKCKHLVINKFFETLHQKYGLHPMQDGCEE